MTTVRLTGLRIGDDPASWRAAGFDVAGDHLGIGGVTIHLAGVASGRGILGWQLAPTPTTGVPGLPDAEVAVAGPGEAHGNGAVALDHLVVGTPDLERTTTDLAGLGLQARRTVVGAQGDDAIAYRFFLLGTCLLELVGPSTGGQAGDARFAGLAFTTTTIDGLGERAGEPRPAVQPGRRIATLRTRELGISVPVAFLTPRPTGT